VKLGFLLLIHQHWSPLSVGIVAEAAPCPLLRFEHQAAYNGIAVHVTQFFDPLFFRKDHEVIEAPLPDVTFFQGCAPQAGSAGLGASTEALEKASGEALFEALHYGRRVATLRFAEEQVHVLRHHHVADDYEVVALPDLPQYLEKEIPILWAV